jgi:hypothetical protein
VPRYWPLPLPCALLEGVLIVLFWWLLTWVAHPANADQWWEYTLVVAYILAPLWAPLLAGFALRLTARPGWMDWRKA